MKFGTVSNAHDNLDYVEAVVLHFESEGVDVVVCCDDIVMPLSVAPSDADFDFHAVHGNNDGEWALREAVESSGTYHSDSAHLTLDGQEIVVYHGMEAGLMDVLVDSGTHDFALCGHGHERVVKHREATTHINPSGLPIPGAGDAFHIAVVDLDTGNVASRSL